MTKLIFLLTVQLAVVVVVVGGVTANVFRPGNDYIYRYKGHILTGIPKLSRHFVGFKIDSKVTLQFQSENNVVMQLSEIKIFTIDDVISTEPLESLSDSEVRRMVGEYSQILTKHLTTPTKFRYYEGQIEGLVKEGDDPDWSLNLKKGILSLFQINLKERSGTAAESNIRNSRVRLRSSIHPIIFSRSSSRKLSNSYKVMENDVTGDCPTKYVIFDVKSPSLSSSSVSEMHVTAVRELDNCQDVPFDVVGMFAGIDGSPAEQDLIERAVHSNYILTGDRFHFLINDVKSSGKYSFRPHGKDGGDISAYTFMTLKLINKKNSANRIFLKKPTNEMKGLRMVISKGEDSIAERDDQKKPNPGHRTTTPANYDNDDNDDDDDETEEEEVRKRLDELIACVYTANQNHCTKKLLSLSTVLRTLQKKTLKAIMIRHLNRTQVERDATYRRRSEILLDTLPTLQQPNAAEVLLELINEERIETLRASLMVNVMSLIVKPTPSVITSMLKLYKKMPSISERKSLEGRTLLKQSLLMGVGMLTRRLYTPIRARRLTSVVVPRERGLFEILDFVETVNNEMKGLFNASTNLLEKVLVLKSMGNLGAIETIPFLKSIMTDDSVDPSLRYQAVIATRQLHPKYFTKSFEPVLMRIFMDATEDQDLRMIAAVAILSFSSSSFGDYATLRMMGQRLGSEPSSQVRSLVYSSLVSLARYSLVDPPAKRERVKNARLVLKAIKPFSIGLHDSVSVTLSTYSDKFDIGGSLNLMKFKSRVSYLPSTLIAKLEATAFGKHRTIFEGGCNKKGIEPVLKRLFGTNGHFKSILDGVTSFWDVLKPDVALNKKMYGTSDARIREITSQLYGVASEEGFSQIWFLRLFDQEFQFLSLTPDSIENFGRTVLARLPDVLYELKKGYEMDVLKTFSFVNALVIASPIGVPIKLDFNALGIVKLDGQVKVDHLPSWSEIYRRKWNTKINWNIDVKPYVELAVSSTLGFDLSSLSGRVGIRGHTISHERSWNSDVTINPNDFTVDAKLHLPPRMAAAEADELFFSAAIALFIQTKFIPGRNAKKPSSYDYEFKERELRMNDDVVHFVPIRLIYRCPIIGIEWHVIGEYAECGPNRCPAFPMRGKHELVVVSNQSAAIANGANFINFKIKSLASLLDDSSGNSRSSSEDESNSDFDSFDGTASSMGSEAREENATRPRIQTRKKEKSANITLDGGQFDRVVPDPFLGDRYHRLPTLAASIGTDRNVDQLQAQLTWFVGKRSWWKQQLNVQFISRSSAECIPKKVQFSGSVNLLASEIVSGQLGEFLGKFELIWLRQNNDENNVTVEILPGSAIRIADELRQHGVETSEDLSARATKYICTMNVNFSRMSGTATKLMTNKIDLLKYKFFDKLTVTIPSDPLQTDKIQIVGEFLPWWETMTLMVKTPRETDYIVGAPFYWNPFLLKHRNIQLHDVAAVATSFSDDSRPPIIGEYRQSPALGGECSYVNHVWTTFDGVQYPHPKTMFKVDQLCEIVIAQDCHGSDLFSVMGIGRPGRSWQMRLLVPQHRIDLIVSGGNVRLRLDDVERTLLTYEQIVIRDNRSSERLYTFDKINNDLLGVTCHKLGLTVTLKHSVPEVYLKLSPTSTYQGKLCGMCGNFNYDQSDDLAVSSSKFPGLPLNLRFVASQVVTSPKCNLDNLPSLFHDYNYDTCVVTRNVTVKRAHNGVTMICSSEEPLTFCTPQCHADGTTHQKYCFTCTGAPAEGSEEGTKEEFELKNFRNVSSFDTSISSNRKCEDYHEYWDIPLHCSPN